MVNASSIFDPSSLLGQAGSSSVIVPKFYDVSFEDFFFIPFLLVEGASDVEDIGL